MEQPKKRLLFRKKPVQNQDVDDYCYGPYSRDEDKYSPSDIVSTRIQQRIEKEKFYSTFCPPVIYDFMNDKDITKPMPIIIVKDVVEPQPQVPVKSGFSIIPADKLREVQREVSRDYSKDKRDSRDIPRDHRSDKRDYRETQRDYRSDNKRDDDYHRNRDRKYGRTTRHCDPPNPYNGSSYKSSKSKIELDTELGKYCRKF
jgi:hypothetical protein